MGEVFSGIEGVGHGPGRKEREKKEKGRKGRRVRHRRKSEGTLGFKPK